MPSIVKGCRPYFEKNKILDFLKQYLMLSLVDRVLVGGLNRG